MKYEELFLIERKNSKTGKAFNGNLAIEKVFKNLFFKIYEELTLFVNKHDFEHFNFNRKLYHFLYDVIEIPKCKYCCLAECHFLGILKGYKDHCLNKNCKIKHLKYVKTLEHYINKFGEEGNKKYEEWKEKHSRSKNFYLKEYGEKGIQLYEKRSRALTKGLTENSFIEKFGKKEGERKYKENRKSRSRGRNYYHQKYGESIGEEKFNVYKNRLSFGHTIDGYIDKYGEEKGVLKWNVIRAKYNIGYSKISQDLFNNILVEMDDKDNIYFATHIYEHPVRINGNFYLVDFFYKKNNSIIEFFGDAFHANPFYFKETDSYHPFNKEPKAIECWKNDEKRIKDLEKAGYRVLIIWEKDYEENKNKVITQCINFIKDVK